MKTLKKLSYVVTLPKFALHTLMHYNAKVRCDQETLEMFELYLPQQIEELVCYIESPRKKICTVEIHNPMCHPKNLKVQPESPKSIWKFQNVWIRQNIFNSEKNEESKMEMSLNFELDLADICQTMTSAANRTRCGPFCQLKVVLKVIEILRESFTLALAHPVNSSLGPIFEPDVKTINMKILIACDGGFKLIQGYCMPCPAHTYSEEGSTDCTECPSGSYQPNIGSKICEKCPHPFKSGCSVLWISPGVISLAILFVLLFIFLSVLLFYSCKIIIGRHICSCIIRIFKKRKEIKEESHFPKKITKVQKKKKLKSFPPAEYEYISEPPIPPVEDFTS